MRQVKLTPDAARRDLQARHAARHRREATARTFGAPPQEAPQPDDPLSISASYFILRRGLAILALAFPVILLIGAGLDHVQGSLSAYYHFAADDPKTNGGGTMRNVFVGVLWAVGAFLVLYKGYSWQEDWALNVGGVGALGVALFPMDWPPLNDVARTATATVHFTSAAVFFLMIAYVCVFRARDTLSILQDADKKKHFARIYRVLGTLMIAVPAAVWLLYQLMPRAETSHVVLLIEVAGVWIFAAFWLVKSREILLIERE